ncbi:hypothetical protein [Streptomyces chartreusis]|uniref:hypothetical protein n=1 Tax=Streptomyces chartreusis TaxID=1969 RepID=UPI0037DD4AD6|nr:hypothetical protein OG938_48390 [Streptomyces chartreusis]
MTEPTRTPVFKEWPTVSGDLVAAYACRAAAVVAGAGSVYLGIAQQWLIFWLVLWLVPSLLVVGGLAHRAHNRRDTGREGAR